MHRPRPGPAPEEEPDPRPVLGGGATLPREVRCPRRRGRASPDIHGVSTKRTRTEGGRGETGRHVDVVAGPGRVDDVDISTSRRWARTTPGPVRGCSRRRGWSRTSCFGEAAQLRIFGLPHFSQADSILMMCKDGIASNRIGIISVY